MPLLEQAIMPTVHTRESENDRCQRHPRQKKERNYPAVSTTPNRNQILKKWNIT